MRYFIKRKIAEISYSPKFRQYGINVVEDKNDSIKIEYCPWCGKKLPKNLRIEWFDEVEKLGLEPNSPELPKKYLTDRWWKLKKI
jgi:hypothetical protein